MAEYGGMKRMVEFVRLSDGDVLLRKAELIFFQQGRCIHSMYVEYYL